MASTSPLLASFALPVRRARDHDTDGSVWVTKDTGCILQYSIDLDKVGKDGKLSKTHYEGGVTKQ
jgi:hypothetical protein